MVRNDLMPQARASGQTTLRRHTGFGQKILREAMCQISATWQSGRWKATVQEVKPIQPLIARRLTKMVLNMCMAKTASLSADCLSETAFFFSNERFTLQWI